MERNKEEQYMRSGGLRRCSGNDVDERWMLKSCSNDDDDDNNMRECGLKRLRLEEDEEEDRLSALPEAIIIDILSRLPIESAVATSVLSSRWRSLWTGITRIWFHSNGITNVDYDCDYDTILNNKVLPFLTCEKLDALDLDLSLLRCNQDQKRSKSEAIASIFDHVCSRNVSHLIYNDRSSSFKLPAFLLYSASLVTLKLCGLFTFKDDHYHRYDYDCEYVFSDDDDDDGGGGGGDNYYYYYDYYYDKKIDPSLISLPNLKVLVLQNLTHFPAPWLEPLLRSCPLLESLTLHVCPTTKDFLHFLDPQPLTVTISGPSLKLLDLNLIFPAQPMTIFIDAPKLTTLVTVDHTTLYHFVHHPTTLLNARLNMRKHCSGGIYYTKRPSLLPNHQHYLRQMSIFFQGLDAVTHLELHLDRCSNFFPTLPRLPIFHNLTHFTATLVDIGLNAWTHLLPSLHCFPFLKDLRVVMHTFCYPIPIDEWNWYAPDSTSPVPRCFASHLKTITISGFRGADVDLKFLAYILTSALVLEELHVTVCFDYPHYEEEEEGNNEADQARQHNFCTSLFKLPRSSSTCKVVFEGPSVASSSVIACEKGTDPNASRGNSTV